MYSSINIWPMAATKQDTLATREIRHTPITLDQQVDLLAHIARGDSLNMWVKENNVAFDKVYKTIRDDSTFAESYALAREDQGDTYGDQIGEIARKTLTGEYEYQNARVAIDGLKWAASKLKSRNWGDRQQIDINMNNKISLIEHIQEVINVTPRLDDEVWAYLSGPLADLRDFVPIITSGCNYLPTWYRIVILIHSP